MRELDNQNPVEAGRSCYRKNPAVYGGSINFALLAIDANTGTVLLGNSGSMTEAAFRKTVLATFPDIAPGSILFYIDGELAGGAKEKKPNKPSVVWRGSYSDLGGYAGMNREITFRLLKRGFSVKLDILRTAPQVDSDTMRMLNVMASTKLHNHNCPLVVGFTPMPVQNRGRKVVFFTMMETQGVHKAFVDTCNRYPSEIWVPCGFYMDAFKKAGITKPLHLIPLGVNEKTYVPTAKEPALDYEEMPSGKIVDRLPEKFRFISLFGWSYRKGPDVLCRSFLKEFDATDDACLVIYSRYQGGSGESQKEHVRNEIRSYYKDVGKASPPPIYYHGNEVPIGDLPGCYAAADCFVFCSRGEGFGLPVVEAGACGIPVISSFNTAMTQYLDDECALLVQTDEMAPANDKLTWITEFYRDQVFPVLGEKAVAEFSRLMRSVYENPEDARKMAESFRNKILKEYTWDACTDRVEKRLRTI
jgi:glycosyltransferase involved in cell wall biosynthesis